MGGSEGGGVRMGWWGVGVGCWGGVLGWMKC